MKTSNIKYKLALNMIVKNEEHVIESTLECISKYIDYYIICDTGSTDNTKEFIKNFFDKKNIKGEIHDTPWKNFGYNRSVALELCNDKCEYCWVIDADDIIVGDLELPKKLDKDCYYLKYGNDFTYNRNQIFRIESKWKYVGVLHEFPASEKKIETSELIKGNYYIDSRRLGDRNKDPDKYKKDANVLLEALKENPDCSRNTFYLAQSYKDYGEYKLSNKYYLKRFKMEGWHEERYYSLYMIGKNNIALGESAITIENSLLKAFRFRNTRLEALYDLVDYLYYKEKNIEKASKYAKLGLEIKSCNDTLFVTSSVYEFKFLDLAYIVFFYNKEYKLSYKIVNELLHNRNIPDGERNRIEYNKSYCIPKVISNYNDYPKIKISNLKNKYTFDCNILLTITSCKRLDLFTKTINSFINCCNDIDMIDKFICIDDNSSEKDRKDMKEMYPFIEFVYKKNDERGHINSMNKIYDLIKIHNPKYLIHLEDDWLFHTKYDYITNGINFLENYGEIGQVLFNRNYAELYDEVDLNIPGGINKNLSNVEYLIHEYCPHNSEKLNLFNKKHSGKASNAYWPHFSFRPSILKANIFKKIGIYSDKNGHFEMDYAKRYTNLGYKSAFFNGIYCKHIGKLTPSRRKDGDNGKNAYQLNNVDQFSNKVMNDNIPIKIINLKRRNDRKEKIEKILNKNKITSYEFIEGIDGNKIKPTINLKYLFEGNDFGNRKGVIGCALSHLNLWKKLINDNENDYYLILEDDIEVCNNFKKKINTLKQDFKNNDVLFLGYSMFEKNRKIYGNTYNNDAVDIKIQKLNSSLYIGGYFAYSINKIGAQKLIDYINNNGIKHGIDYLNKIININNFECIPQLVFTKWNENGKEIDTDIQNNYNSFDFNSIEDSFIFVPNKDQIGNDFFYNKKSINVMKRNALNDKNCVAFNTLGFYKNKIDKLTHSKYFENNDGIYIKKFYYDKFINNINKNKSKIDSKTKIKMLCNWCSSEELLKQWSNMFNDDLIYKDIQLTHDNNDIDYYIILNKPMENAKYKPEKTIIFQMEPWVYDKDKNWGVKTWGEWSEPDEKKFLYVSTHKKELNNVQWWVNIPKKFPKIRKDQVISILSNKDFDTGHKLRIDISKNNNKIDVFGKENFHNLKNYIGKIDKKETEYINYKYCLIVENNNEINYATEKLWDGILCECLCFYWGCPNLEEYIDSDVFIRLDQNNIKKSLKIIDDAIKNDEWSKRISKIKKIKHKIINELGFLPRLRKIVNSFK